MTTGGEGGMVTINDAGLWSRIWSYKDHGKSWEAVYEREHPPGFRWLHESFGTNLRMMEMQATIGRIQLKRMPHWHQQRKRNAEAILGACRQYSMALRVPNVPDDIEHAWYRCYVFVRPEGLKEGWTRDRIMSEINLLGVPCNTGACSEVYLEKAFDGTGFRPEKRLPVARVLGETSLSFLVHPTLTEKDIDKTVEVILKVLRSAAL
jgi:dTDP-4-amino-4,6-dideoxygalactose transaminase